MTHTLIDIAAAALEAAKRAGANEVAATASRAREVEVQWRDGKIDKVSEATARALDLELYVGGSYAAMSTSDLRPDAVASFIASSVALTRKLSPDPFRALPDPRLYLGQAKIDLDLEDARYLELDAKQRRDLARDMEAAARAVAGKGTLLSATSGFGDTQGQSVRVHSNGFVGERRATRFAMSTEVAVQDPDGRRPEDWEMGAARYFADLPRAEDVGRMAAERAYRRIGAQKGESARLMMAVDARAAARLLGYLLAPLSAAALQQKRSFLDGKLGQSVASPLLTLHDDPLVRRGLGSRLFDGEGLAAKRFAVFEASKLASYYVDDYYGKKLGMAPSTRGISNLAWQLGAKSQGALLAELDSGILVTSFLGGNSNATTGDFSLGVVGYRVQGGVKAEPIGEMNISGNHLEFWRHLVAVGNDPYAYSAFYTPTLVFEDVQFAGV